MNPPYRALCLLLLDPPMSMEKSTYFLLLLFLFGKKYTVVFKDMAFYFPSALCYVCVLTTERNTLPNTDIYDGRIQLFPNANLISAFYSRIEMENSLELFCFLF